MSEQPTLRQLQSLQQDTWRNSMREGNSYRSAEHPTLVIEARMMALFRTLFLKGGGIAVREREIQFGKIAENC